MARFDLILVDPIAALCNAWEQHFEDLPGVKIANGLFEDLPRYDCLVSAANSFGLMDGGIDRAIIEYFGYDLMDRVQAHILEHYLGEQPVGTSFIIETGHVQYPFLAHTPTMRAPMPIAGTDNVYNAMWAMLLTVRQHNLRSRRAIEIVACPGLGTATGGMAYEEAARQMAAAYRHFLSPPNAISWPYAITRHNAVGTNGRSK